MRVFLCGDVMTGRGIDQILENASEPTLHEPYIKDAREYVRLAEKVNGRVPRGVDGSYVWGDALDLWKEYRPDFHVLNLETSITTSSRAWPDKGIHYRMHPANARLLTLPEECSGTPVCYSLANNHVMDWGRDGLIETLGTLSTLDGERTLHRGSPVRGEIASHSIGWCGAGRSVSEAAAPWWAGHEDPDRAGEGTGQAGEAGSGEPSDRLAVFAMGFADSGIPPEWVCGESETGVYRLAAADASTSESEAFRIAQARGPAGRAVCSVHWGGNWGYRIPGEHRRLARAMIDRGASIVHGHSSHHVKGFEVYRGGLILYGCGDFVSDYEGIPDKEAYRPDLSLMFFADIDGHGVVQTLQMVPLRKVRFSLRRADREDANWLASVLNRESSKIQGDVEARADGTLLWEPPARVTLSCPSILHTAVRVYSR